MTKNSVKQRLLYLDVLRIFSIFAVVIIHVAARNWYKTDVHSIEWLCFNFYDSVARWAVPMFIMISGTLFLNPERQISVKELYKKNIARILIVFVLWSAFYLIYTCIKAHKIFPFLILYRNFFKGYYHLWFLPTIAGLYMIVPLLKEMIKEKYLLKYFVTLSMFFTFLMPTIQSVISAVAPLTDNNTLKDIYTPIYSFYGNINFSLTLKYVAYFVLGYYLSCTEFKPAGKKILYVLCLLSFAFMVCFSAYIAQAKNQSYGFYGYMSLTVMIESVAIFLFMKNINWNGLNDRLKNMIVFTSNRALGIYLIHAMILDILARYFGFQSLAFNTYISTPIIATVAFILSLVVAIILHKIPKIGKYLG